MSSEYEDLTGVRDGGKVWIREVLVMLNKHFVNVVVFPNNAAKSLDEVTSFKLAVEETSHKVLDYLVASLLKDELIKVHFDYV